MSENQSSKKKRPAANTAEPREKKAGQKPTASKKKKPNSKKSSGKQTSSQSGRPTTAKSKKRPASTAVETQSSKKPKKPNAKNSARDQNIKKKPRKTKKRRPAPRKKRRSCWKIILSIFSTLFFLILIAGSIIFMIFFGRGEIAGDDMNPTLNNQESIIYRKLTADETDETNSLGLERFDIVLLQSPEDTSQIGMKRVIGLPGETVRYENGRLYVDNQWVTEDFYEGVNSSFYLAPENNFTMSEIIEATPSLANSNAAEIIPADYYLVLGDNRTMAVDSRQFGLVPADNIVGKVEWILFPFDRFGKIE